MAVFEWDLLRRLLPNNPTLSGEIFSENGFPNQPAGLPGMLNQPDTSLYNQISPSLYEGNTIGNFNTEPLAAPEVPVTAAEEPKSKWRQFGETIQKWAPVILAAAGLANPDQNAAIAYTALKTYNQAQADQDAKELANKQYQDTQDFKERQMLESKTQNAWERYKDQVEMNRQKDIDRQTQENKEADRALKESDLTLEEKLANLKADTDVKIANIRANDNGGSNTTQQKLEQQKAATLIASMAGQFKRREDFLADMRRHRKELVQRMGQENYDKLYQVAETSTNIWPDGGPGVNFVPGQGSPIRTWLYGSAPKKPLIAGNKNGSKNTPVQTKQVRNKKTGEVMTAYVGVRDGQLYTTEEEARRH